MLTEDGRVVAVENDGLWIETLKQSACAQCSAKSGCGQKLLAESALKDMTYIKAYFANGRSERIWKEGDTAVIGIEEGALLTATFIAYLSPLFFLLVFASLAHYFAVPEPAVALAAIFGLIAGGLLVRSHASNHDSQSCYQAKVLC